MWRAGRIGGGFFDEVRNPVAQRVDLDRETDRQSLVAPQLDHPVE